MSTVTVPVTCRLDEDTVAALDRAVTDGAAGSRSGLIAHAVAEWLERHDEELIVASYRRRYAEPDPEHDALVHAGMLTSIDAILRQADGDAPG